jgi:hypothetical protein
MTTTHRPYSFIAGDDWQINIRLTDHLERPYNLNGVKIMWLLHSPMGEIVQHDYMIRIINAVQGTFSVFIPNDVTSPFVAGIWTDWVRIDCNGIVSTLLTGPVVVTADPWRARIYEAPRAIGRSEENVIVKLSAKERIVREAEIIPFRKASDG